MFGLTAGLLRSELKLPPALYETLSIILLLAIGLHGGVELAEQASPALVGQMGLVLLLLEMGLIASKQMGALKRVGVRLVSFALIMPCIGAATGLGVATLMGLSVCATPAGITTAMCVSRLFAARHWQKS